MTPAIAPPSSSPPLCCLCVSRKISRKKNTTDFTTREGLYEGRLCYTCVTTGRLFFLLLEDAWSGAACFYTCITRPSLLLEDACSSLLLEDACSSLLLHDACSRAAFFLPVSLLSAYENTYVVIVWEHTHTNTHLSSRAAFFLPVSLLSAYENTTYVVIVWEHIYSSRMRTLI